MYPRRLELIWLIGFFALLLASVLVVTPRVERSLLDDVQSALAEAEVSADIQVLGRDVDVVVQNESARQAALTALDDQDRIRRLSVGVQEPLGTEKDDR